MSELRGCTDGNCIIRKPEGMHTNGGCGCERELRHALGLQDSRRFIHALRERQREVAELREALGSLQEMLAKQIVGTETGAVCAACGESSKYGEPVHGERCPVARGLAIIEAAFKPHAQEHGSAK